MPTVSEIVDSTLSDQAFLEKMARRHEARLLSSIGKLRDNITNTLAQLETTPAGRLKGVKVNLKQSQRLHKKIVTEFEKEYNKKVDTMLGDFSEIGSLVDSSYRHLGEAAKFTSIDKTMMDTLKNQTYDRYKQFGDEARDRIARSMYDSVAGGAKFNSLLNTVTGVLTGHKDVAGRSMTMYAKGYAQDAIMNFHNQVNVKKGEDLGMSHFLYYGNLIDTSRPFCITRAGKVYSKTQIMTWDNMAWKGKSGPALQERGGYNCRHSWRPVRPEWFKDDEGLPVPREEIVGYMHPNAPGVSQNINQIKAKEKELSTGQAKLKELQVDQTKFKKLKAAGKATAAQKADYALLRKEIKAQQVANSAIRAELKTLKTGLADKGKKIIKKAKKTAKLATVKKAPKVKSAKDKLTTTQVYETKDGIRVVRYPGVSRKFFEHEYSLIEKLPPDVRKRLAERNIEISIGHHMTDIAPELKGVTPRGWKVGTWDESEGAFDPVKRKVMVTSHTTDWTGKKFNAVFRDRSIEAFFHEVGHAVDDIYGDISWDQAFIKAYRKDLVSINDAGHRHLYQYYLQEGSAGREETFAQIFANIVGEAVEHDPIYTAFPNTVKYMQKKLKLVKKKTFKVAEAMDELTDKKFSVVSESWAEKNFANWYGGLDDYDVDALANYKVAGGSGGGIVNVYEDINYWLRHGGQTEYKESKRYARIITDLLDRSSATVAKDIYVFRGVSDGMMKKFENGVGKVFKDKAFMSTSVDALTADTFADQAGGTIVRIKVPKGAKGAYLGWPDIDLDLFNEGEILFQRGTKIRILSKRHKVLVPDYDDAFTVIDAEMIVGAEKTKKVVKKTTKKVVKKTTKKEGVYWDGEWVGERDILRIDNPAYTRSAWEREAKITGELLHNERIGGTTSEKYFPKKMLAPLEKPTSKGAIEIKYEKGARIFDRDALEADTRYYAERLFGDDAPKIVIRTGGNDPVGMAEQAYNAKTDTATITLFTGGNDGFKDAWGEKLTKKNIHEVVHRESVAHELVHIQQKRMGRYQIVYQDSKPIPKDKVFAGADISSERSFLATAKMQKDMSELTDLKIANIQGGKVVVGKPGETHAMLMSRTGGDWENTITGFVKDGEFIYQAGGEGTMKHIYKNLRSQLDYSISPVPPMAQLGTVESNYVRKGKVWYLNGKEVARNTAKKLDDMKLPPAWTNVYVSTDPTTKLQAIGMDKAGRWQYRYSAEHIAESARLKFDNVKMFTRDMTKIRKEIWKGINEGDPRAFLLELENRTAIRAGTTTDLKAKVKAYGLTTLQHEHVVVKGNHIIIDFVSKKGVKAHYELTDKTLADWLRVRKQSTKKGQKLFPDVSAARLNKYLKDISQKSYTIKDFRTYHGTRIAYEELKEYAGLILEPSEKKAVINAVSKKVADFLHNTPSIARSAYIDPMVWEFIGGL